MSTKAEKIKAQSLAAVGVPFNDYRRHIVGPNELEAALEAMEILKEMLPQFEGISQFYIGYVSEGDVAEEDITRLIRRAKEVV